MLNSVNPAAERAKIQGIQQYRAGAFTEAAALFRQALALVPGDADLLDLTGMALRRSGDVAGAAAHYREAVRRHGDPRLLANAGAAFIDAGLRDEAAAALDRAVGQLPAHLPARHNLARALLMTGRAEEALAHLDVASGLLGSQSPSAERATLLTTRGIALSLAGCAREAAGLLEQSLALFPSPESHSRLLFALQESGADPLAVRQAAISGAALHGPALPPPAWENTSLPERPLRVGYVSADFHRHPVTTFFEPLLAAHDPAQAQAFCYSNGQQEDDVTARLRAGACHWRSIASLSDEHAAALVRADAIDILVDLSGHTAGNRLGLFARHAAPIQVAYLGYPGTTGIPAIAWRFTDPLLDPPDGSTDPLCTECLIRLPAPFAVYRPPDDAPEPGPLPADSRGICTFASFNGRSKISDDLLGTWADILAAVPGSRLALHGFDTGAAARRRVEALFAARGIAADRLALTGRLAMADYLAAHRQADIALDSFPLSGHTVVCHALWMGVPVVCRQGRTCWERLASGVLGVLNLPELVAGTSASYVEIAVRLASDLPRLRGLRASLRDRMRASRLMEYPAHARHVEAAFRRLWRDWCAGRS